jgi:hypothetical protein
MPGVSTPQWMQDLIAGWPMIRANLPTFFVILFLMIGALWIAFNWSYGGVLASKNAQIELLDRQVAQLKQQVPGQGQGLRRLSEAQRRDMAERLRSGRSNVVVTFDMACGDCGQYAADFMRVLRDAEGWAISQGGVMGPDNRPATGLGLRVRDLNTLTPDAQRLTRALKANNIEFELQPMGGGPPRGDIELLVVAP